MDRHPGVTARAVTLCLHERAVPVAAVAGEDVAALCLDCDAQLPAGWGCPDCDYADFTVAESATFGRVRIFACEAHR